VTYRGVTCTEIRAFSDATGAGFEWRFPANSDGTTWPVGEQWCSREHTTRTTPTPGTGAQALVGAGNRMVFAGADGVLVAP
jgi:hypothetical protein